MRGKMLNVQEYRDELKAELQNRCSEVNSELERLFKKYGVKSFEELQHRFEEIPEEEGLDDYFLAQNLEAFRRELGKLFSIFLLEDRLQ